MTGYRRALLVRWSRRDRLAVLVVAVTVAFLTGTTLLLLAAGGQVAVAAADYGSSGAATFHDDPGDARAVADPDGVVLPVANATVDGNRVTLVGVPGGTDASLGTERPLRPGDGTTSGELSAPTEVTVEGSAGRVTLTATPRDPRGSVLPPSWYVTDPDTVEGVGETDAFVVRPGDPVRGVPLLGALDFFVRGTGQALRALAAVAGGTALLVGVTVFSVSRMSVRGRLPTIRIVRATGAAPRTVLGVFTLRAALLTATGVALGYALGVVVASGAVTVAVAVGLPTTLSVRVSSRAVGVLVPLYGALLAVGVVAGAAAVRPAVRRPPGRLTDDVSPTSADDEGRWTVLSAPDGLPSALSPSLLRWRALVPTTAALSAFVAFVVVVAGLAGTAAPVVSAGGVTVTEPGAAHPVASNVPEGYAAALRTRGIDASAEILLFEVVDGRPLPARGAAFGPFANVTDAELLQGEPHGNPHEATVGRDLARSLGVDVGDALTLGGSTRSALTRVRVVGVFVAPGPYDDQLLVSLPAARHLAEQDSGLVQFVRADRLPDARRSGATSSEVVGISTPGTVLANGSFRVRVDVRNPGFRDEVRNLTVRYRGQERSTRFTIKRTQTRTLTFQFGTGPPGTGTVRAGNRTATVEVRRADALDVTGLPSRAPPGSEPLLRVTNATGAPVAGAAVSVVNDTEPTDGTTRTTDADGYARVPLAATGARTARAAVGDRTVETQVTVAEGAPRDPAASLSVEPSSPSVLAVPEARLSLSNPWNRTLVRTVGLGGPGTERRQSVRLGPGERVTLRADLETRPPGTYTVRASLNGSVVAERPYRVTGDERVLSALASGGRTGTTGVGQAIEVAFGNLRVVVGALFGLAALMTVGGTTATFAGAVHARRRTVGIHRATGARPRDVLVLVGRDAALVGAVASVLAVVLAQAGLLALARFGYLTAFGVTLPATLDPLALLGTVLGGVALTVLGAGLATAGLLRESPADLLDDSGTGRAGGSDPGGTDDPTGVTGSDD
ncbi:MAG: FtsX-like permease family protein [Haloarculaceae archaeon]